jgi:hypothetical protein
MTFRRGRDYPLRRGWANASKASEATTQALIGPPPVEVFLCFPCPGNDKVQKGMIDEETSWFDQVERIQFLEEFQFGADLLRSRDGHRAGPIN